MQDTNTKPVEEAARAELAAQVSKAEPVGKMAMVEQAEYVTTKVENESPNVEQVNHRGNN